MRLGFLGAPLRATSAEEGVEHAPAVLRAAGALSVLGALPGAMVRDLGDLDLPKAESEDLSTPAGAVRNHERIRLSMLRVARAVALGMEQGLAPVVAGGDCTVLLGTLAGLRDARPGRRLGLVSLDAFGEFHTPQTSRTQDVARMTLALAVGRGDVSLARLARNDFPLIQERDVLRLGAREVDPAEASALFSSRITLLSAEELAGATGQARLSTELGRLLPRAPDIVVHVSGSVLDPKTFPCVPGSPPPGGLSATRLRTILDELLAWRAHGKLTIAGLVLAGIDGRKDEGGILVRPLFETVARLLAD